LPLLPTLRDLESETFQFFTIRLVDPT
jgi:hypothetical protein